MKTVSTEDDTVTVVRALVRLGVVEERLRPDRNGVMQLMYRMSPLGKRVREYQDHLERF